MSSSSSTVPAVVLVGARRTPVGCFQGQLASLTAPKLGGVAIRAALEDANLAPDAVDAAIVGHVLGAGVGQHPGRQAALAGGLPESVDCVSVNKMCGSGMKALMLASAMIRSGDASAVVCAGMESMSRAPYSVPSMRTGQRSGHTQMMDLCIVDGLWDVYTDVAMGTCAEKLVARMQFTRADQDAYAAESYRRARAAIEEHRFDREIAPVTVPGTGRGSRSAGPTVVSADEEPSRLDPAAFGGMRPCFLTNEEGGTITPGNASKLNDGASAVVAMSADRAKELGLTARARVVAYGAAGRESTFFTLAPVDAIRRALEIAHWEVDSVDAFEVNEAFSVVAMAAMRELNIPHEKVNRHGGAVALGHPIGSSGLRIVVSLLNIMETYNLRRGCAAICIGGGEGTAILLERDV